MPNHIHILFTPLRTSEGGYHAMSAIMHSLKLYTARESNRLLGRIGQFWQHENYDHVLRNEAELNRITRYVLNNPVMAGVVEYWEDWKWSYCQYPL
jgi:REP element-mobilizing transposase RayT